MQFRGLLILFICLASVSMGLAQTAPVETPVAQRGYMIGPGDEITARVTVTEIREDKPILKVETICMNQRDEIVIRGEATVLAADKRR